MLACFDEDVTAVYSSSTPPSRTYGGGKHNRLWCFKAHIYTQQQEVVAPKTPEDRALRSRRSISTTSCVFSAADIGFLFLYPPAVCGTPKRGEFFDENDDAKYTAPGHRVRETTRSRPHRALHRTRSRRETAAASAPA